MKLKPFTYFLCAIAVMLALVSPLIIKSFLYVPPETDRYKGMLVLWNITDWRTGGSSCFSFLRKRTGEFEAKNASIFVDSIDMSVAEAEEAIGKGETPDILSYPLGFESTLEFSQLPYKETLFNNVSSKTYPFICGGYCMLVNTDMLDQKGLLTPDNWGVVPKELIEIAKNGIEFDSEQGYSSLPSIALYEFPDTKGPDISTCDETAQPEIVSNISISAFNGGLKSFCEGKSCILIASQRQLFETRQMYQDNRAPSFKAFALSGYTDMFQMIGVVKSDDRKKTEACTDFAAYLLSAPVQKKVEALGVFPVIAGLDIYQSDECLYSVYALLCEGNYPSNPKNTNLPALAEKALEGDADALSRLRRNAGYTTRD
jgi:hypothetical protein